MLLIKRACHLSPALRPSLSGRRVATVAGGFGSDLAEELVVGMRDGSRWLQVVPACPPEPTDLRVALGQ